MMHGHTLAFLSALAYHAGDIPTAQRYAILLIQWCARDRGTMVVNVGRYAA